jgi:hypothetical protein
VLLDIMRSEEFTSKLARPAAPLASLRAQRPAQYRSAVDLTNRQTILVFDVRSSSDFDWLEQAILANGYYEKPGVWVLGVDADKRVVAGIIAALEPRRALELGCASGAVIECLEAHGVFAEGVEISAMAIERAPAPIRPRIHRGDLLDLGIESGFDVIFGLDVFEHLNPNRLDAYLSRLAEISSEDALLFCNIPAFGNDPVFGTVFPFYVEGWEQDGRAGRLFSSIHVDDEGYPIHGHLIWADARWWTAQFEAAGFTRDAGIERALHRKYDGYMEQRSPARKAFFVFAKPAAAARRPAILARIEALRLEALA